MKTALVFTTQESCDFYLVDGDWSRFEQIFINLMGTEEQEKLADELCGLLYDENTGAFRLPKVSREEFTAAIRNGAEIVHCGEML